MRQEPYKVYGYVYPAVDVLYKELEAVLYEFNIGECLELDGDILQISFEGMFFPVEEVIEILCLYAVENYSGKLDMLDLENWTLYRTIFKGNNRSSSKVSLNHVLDYSGH